MNLPYAFFLILFLSYDNGHKFLNEGKYEEAIKEFSEFLETNPKGEKRILAETELSEAYYQLGKQKFIEGDLILALYLFYSSNTQKADKELPRIHYRLAEKYRKEKNFDEAVRHLNSIIQNFEDSDYFGDALYLKMKMAFEDYKNFEIAYKLYKQIQSEVSDYSIKEKSKAFAEDIGKKLINEANSLTERGSYDKALDLYSMAYSIAPGLETMSHETFEKAKIGELLKKAEAYLREDNFTLAEQYYNEVLNIAPYNKKATEGLLQVRRKRLKREHPEWSSKWINMILSRKIAVGMTKEMVKEAWGKPDIEDYDYYEGLYYYKYYSDPLMGRNVKIYFRDNKCVKISGG